MGKTAFEGCYFSACWQSSSVAQVLYVPTHQMRPAAHVAQNLSDVNLLVGIAADAGLSLCNSMSFIPTAVRRQAH